MNCKNCPDKEMCKANGCPQGREPVSLIEKMSYYSYHKDRFYDKLMVLLNKEILKLKP